MNEINFIFLDKSYISEENFFKLFKKEPFNAKTGAAIFLENLMFSIFNPNQEPIPIKEVVSKREEKEQPLIFYGAIYNRFKGLKIIKVSGGKAKYLSDNVSYDIFYKHATFYEILNSFEPNSGDEVLKKLIEFKDRKGEKHLILQVIRDNPVMLGDKHICFELIKILQTARWSINKKEMVEAKNFLKNNLIFKQPGGKQGLPANINLLVDILEELVLHLSNKCKAYTDCYIERKNGKLHEDDYNNLIKWAKTERDFRISRLSQDDLSTLIFKPITYIHNIIERHFKVSYKTVKRNRVR